MTHDKPKEELDEDIFRRKQFSLQIAAMIRARTQKESIVIGINGPWGEGKTSVLNFVMSDLKQDSDKIIVLKFNPWLFRDEEGLVKTFFQSVTEIIRNSLKTDELKNGIMNNQVTEDLKALGSIIYGYSEPFIEEIPTAGFWHKKLSKVVRWLTTTELERRKQQLGNLVGKYERKVIIVIDDIDRLSKDEVYSIFRLVKLTADFDHFIYLMAYDNDRVAEAIGSRFGNDKDAGRHFLDKIVQVPLSLPLILKDDLTILFRTALFKILDENGIALEREELRRFVDLYDIAFVNKIDSPRKVIRYLNAIEFSLSIMKEETNTIDLILIEGMKVFYPDHYEFVKMNERILTNWSAADQMQGVDELNDIYSQLKKNLDVRDIRNAEAILLDLFPLTRHVWRDVSLSPDQLTQLTIQKRVGSIEYFNRYFTLALTDFDIPEKVFRELINQVDKQPIEKTIELVKNLQPDSLIMKLRYVERNLSVDQSMAIVRLLTALSVKFYNGAEFFLEGSSPLSQAAILVSNLVRNIKIQRERYDILSTVVLNGPSVIFSAETIRWIAHPSNSGQILETHELSKLRTQLRTRVLSESGKQAFYVLYPDLARDILSEWSGVEREALLQYVKAQVVDLPTVIDFLVGIADKRFTNSRGLVISDINESDYKLIDFSVGAVWLYEFLLKTVDESFSQDVRVNTQNGSQDGENLIKQFMFWHERRLGPKWQIRAVANRLNKDEDIANSRLSIVVIKDVLNRDIIPLLMEVETNTLELVALFNDYDRDIRLNGGGTSAQVGNKSTSWKDVIELIVMTLQKTDHFSLQSLDYDLLLRGYKKNTTAQYMRTSLKFQFYEYTYSVSLNNSNTNQPSFAYSDPLGKEKFDLIITDAAHQLTEQLNKAR